MANPSNLSSKQQNKMKTIELITAVALGFGLGVFLVGLAFIKMIATITSKEVHQNVEESNRLLRERNVTGEVQLDILRDIKNEWKGLRQP